MAVQQGPTMKVHVDAGRLWFLAPLVVITLWASCRPAYAYIDPGTFSSLFGSLGPIIGLALAGLGLLLWPFRWVAKRLWSWAKQRPALVAIGRAVAWAFAPVVRFLWWVLWPLRRSASVVGSAAKTHPRRAFLVGAGAALAGLALGAWHLLLRRKGPARARSGRRRGRVIVLGIDGLDPKILERMMRAGELVNFRRLRAQGGFARLATSIPAHSPNAWSCIATGCDAGQHGVFDFILRDPETYRLDLGILRRGRREALGLGSSTFLPARRCPAFWDLLSDAGVPATVVRWPVTFPPDAISGRALAGLGVPDIKGGLGSYTFYTTRRPGSDEEGREKVVVVEPKGSVIETDIVGPQVAGLGGASASRVPLRIELHPDRGRVTLSVGGEARELAVGEWSRYVHLRFKTGALGNVAGLAAFRLKAVRPHLELYLSPIELDPLDPAFPISSPEAYATELAKAIGSYHTLSIPEDTKAVTEGRLDLDAFLHLCGQIQRERERVLLHELDRFGDGLLAVVADTSDRLQHMFWVTRDPAHPLHNPALARRYAHVIPDVYRDADRLLGHVLGRADDQTIVLVVSDHGFAPFRRAVHLNRWLADNGFLALTDAEPDPEGGVLFRDVLWEETSAYAAGFGGIYVNLRGREGQGAIAPGSEYGSVCERIATGLRDLRDPKTGQHPIRRVYFRDELYHGPLASEGPDLVVGFKPGYRASWQTALGGAPQGRFADNRKLWSGDHIVDPHYVPGILLANRPFAHTTLRQVDVAPTVLKVLSVPRASAMKGDALV